MRSMLTGISDKLVGLVVPQVEAQAVTCSEAASGCNGNCPFWYWRRYHYITCSNGAAWTDFECCGCGC